MKTTLKIVETYKQRSLRKGNHKFILLNQSFKTIKYKSITCYNFIEKKQKFIELIKVLFNTANKF